MKDKSKLLLKTIFLILLIAVTATGLTVWIKFGVQKEILIWEFLRGGAK